MKVLTMKKIKKYLLASVIATGMTFSQQQSVASGFPVIDGALLNNDVTSWIKDTMTELEHHIQTYETMINQYETLYNQYNYMKSQYSGLIDSVKNIRDLKSMYQTYLQAVNTYNSTINKYNEFARAANHELATVCDKLQSSTLNASACTSEIRAFLQSMEETTEQIKNDNDPKVEGSFANQMEVEKQYLDKWVDSLKKRGETDDKAGQLLKDLRHTQVLINQQLQSQRDLTHKIYDEHLLRKQKEETREARQKLMQTSFEASLERDMKAFKEAGEKVKLFFNEDFK